MKTYWLEKRSWRSIVTRNIVIQEPPQYMNRTNENNKIPPGINYHSSVPTPMSPTKLTYRHSYLDKSIKSPGSRISSPTPFGSSALTSDERRIYSPITFQDVARRSVANSPTKNPDVRGKF